MTAGTRLEIVPYDPAWPERFAAERDRLADALGDAALRIDHVGSTSVPGLGAKDVIDIQISVTDVLDAFRYRPALEKLGYAYTPHPDEDGFDRYPFFGFPAEHPRRFHVHVCSLGSAVERRTLAFPAALRADAGLAAEYEALKRDLAPRYEAADPAQREAYSDAKSPFIRRALGERT